MDQRRSSQKTTTYEHAANERYGFTLNESIGGTSWNCRKFLLRPWLQQKEEEVRASSIKVADEQQSADEYAGEEYGTPS